ncbi:MAG: transposase [Bacteroidetes bacterium]|nr:transposase [Bacteroidota bacterium]
MDKCINSPDWLKIPAIANIVIESWLFFNGMKYDLFCITVMSNHVHVIFKPLKKKDFPFSISEIIKGAKTYTAREANKILGRVGQFWSREYYDHVIRNEDEFRYYFRYTLENPVKAGLVNKAEDWKFYWVKEGLLTEGY